MRRVMHSSGGRGREILGLILMAVAVFAMVSLISYSKEYSPDSSLFPSQSTNWGGRLGAITANFLFGAVGYAAFALPLVAFAWGWNRFRRLPVRSLAVRTAGIVIVGLSYCSILALFHQNATDAFRFGGFAGIWLAQRIWQPYLGRVGSTILIAALVATTLILTMGIRFSGIVGAMGLALRGSVERLWSIRWRRGKPLRERQKPGGVKVRRTVRGGVRRPTSPTEAKVNRESMVAPSMIEFATPHIVEAPSTQAEREELAEEKGEESSTDREAAGPVSAKEAERSRLPRKVSYQLPSVDLFDAPPAGEDKQTKEQLLDCADRVEASLRDFGVEARVAHISPGPVITCYAVEPAAGVKVSRIISLADDLALVMKAKRIRIAPMLGKSTVGIEVPNPKPSIVYLEEVLQSEAYRSVSSKLKVALGKTTSGDPYVTDLAGMPHLLIAGATGSGKSVCLHTIISSILYNATPEEARLIMVDPKMLELPVYDDVPHLLAPVVTKPRRATEALRWAVNEMDVRYRQLAGFGVRNILDYNEEVQESLAEQQDYEDPSEVPSPLPFIVIIIDELADLMMTAADDIEEPIARLAQMARAVGIHLILATQRPSVDVITGVIKANFPARLAFQVASKVDSRTVLDMNGAEKLLGNGDMLFLPPGQPEPIRIHGSFVSTKETGRLVSMIRKQRIRAEQVEIFGESSGADVGGWDELFNEAVRVVVSLQQGSVSLLQRRLKIGYARAGRLMDQLEAAGIVGPADGSKAREVLVDESYLDDLES